MIWKIWEKVKRKKCSYYWRVSAAPSESWTCCWRSWRYCWRIWTNRSPEAGVGWRPVELGKQKRQIGERATGRWSCDDTKWFIGLIYRLDIALLFEQRGLQLTAAGTQDALEDRNVSVSTALLFLCDVCECFLMFIKDFLVLLSVFSPSKLNLQPSTYHLQRGVRTSSIVRLLLLLLHLASSGGRSGSASVPGWRTFTL